jgi:hypothetical protein
MAKHPLYDDASEVAAKGGEVDVDGPDGVAVSLTPEAALETGHRLIEKGAEAAGQRHWNETGCGQRSK